MELSSFSPVSTPYRNRVLVRPESTYRKTPRPEEPRAVVKSAEDALDILKESPDYQSLLAVLRFLADGQDRESCSITRPSPQSAKLVQALVTDIAPNYWNLLKDESKDDSSTAERGSSGLDLLLGCLRSLAGINAAVAHLKALLQAAKSGGKEGKGSGISLTIALTLELLCTILEGSDRMYQILASTTAGPQDPARQKLLSRELLVVLGGGRIVSLSAEAEQIIKQGVEKKQGVQYWISDGLSYSNWLGQNISTWILKEPPDVEVKFCAALLEKALRLGHSDALIKYLIQTLVVNCPIGTGGFHDVFKNLSQTEQRRVLYTALKILSESHLNRLGDCESADALPLISAAAGTIHSIIGPNESGKNQLVMWLTNSTGAGIGEGIGIRRAVLAVVAKDMESITSVLEKSIRLFGDQLYVKHAPTLQQDAHAQILIMCAGYVHRMLPMKLTFFTRSSEWLHAVSNRIATSHSRARFLGMVVGEAISSMVDKGEKQLDFHMEETKSKEGQWYKGLATVSDDKGPLHPLQEHPRTLGPIIPDQQLSKHPSKKTTAPRPRVVKPPTQGFIIEEVEDEGDEEDDIVPYAKPDSDAEDSDDDPTLVNRDKPKSAVYIRDLIRQFRDTDNYDKQKLALSTAPLLIRRKANYGTEVSEHSEELASLLVGLQNKFDIEDFDDLRTQGMIAIIVAQPQVMGQWFARTFFDGDYSLNQRASVLTVLGLSARELAGFDVSEYSQAASYASKRLPEQVERLFIDAGAPTSTLPRSSSLIALPPTALDTIAQDMTTDFLAPIAANAADAATGPDVLKLSTFSSRLRDQGNSPNVTRKSKGKPRIRTIPNTTAQLISASFFSPLVARFQAAIHSPASRTRGVVFQPMLLALYLKTLGMLLYAAGPSTLSLPQMTVELWGLLLSTSVRAACVGELSVTGAVLFSLLVLVEVSQDRMRDLCQDMGRELVETQEWVGSVFEGIRGEDGGEENQAKMLAAGVLIRLKEGIEKYRLLLVGDLIG